MDSLTSNPSLSERLRLAHKFETIDASDVLLFNEAADELDRLERELRLAISARDYANAMLDASRNPPEATGPRWIPVSERLPESGVPVLAHITNSHGKTRRLRAQWIAKHTDELWDGDDMAGDYSEETDTTYTPEGWYETNEYEETHFHINDPVSHWMPLPPGPDQASTPVEPKPSEATGLQCEKDGVCALVSRNDDEWHCTACNGDFVRKQPVEPLPAEATGGYLSGWVIEGAWSPVDRPEYWAGSSIWSADAYKALRFATRESAQQAAGLMCAGVNVRIACHDWAEKENHNEQ